MNNQVYKMNTKINSQQSFLIFLTNLYNVSQNDTLFFELLSGQFKSLKRSKLDTVQIEVNRHLSNFRINLKSSEMNKILSQFCTKNKITFNSSLKTA